MRKEVVIEGNEVTGATPIARLVQLANSFDSSIYLTKEGIKVNAKSIMGMMNLVLSPGTFVVIEASGDDEKDAIDAIERFLLNLGSDE